MADQPENRSSLNWKEIDLILSELPLAGARIQGILQPDFHTLVWELYTSAGPLSLLLCVAQGAARLHAITAKPEKSAKLQRFAQFLRSRIRGGRIVDVRQLGQDRIVRIEVTRAGETTLIYARLWSGAGNVIAAEPDGTILDAMFRRPARGEVTGGLFKPDAASSPIRSAAACIETPAARAAAESTSLAESSEAWAAHLEPAPAQAAPRREYPIRELPGDASFNRKIETLFGKTPRGEDPLEDLRTHVMEALDAMILDAEESAGDTGKKLKELEDFERNRELGDLVMANLHLIAPAVSQIDVEDFHHGGSRVIIGIDPDLSGPENAELFYEKAKKGKRTAAYLAEEAKRITAELARLQTLRARATVETDLDKLRSLVPTRAARQTRERQAKPSGSTDKPTPGLTFRSGGFTILVGRTAAENDELLRKHVKGNDVWLHARDFPGGYVFIKGVRDKSIPLEVLLDAGALAIHFSKGRAGGKGEVYYTFVKYLRRARDAKKERSYRPRRRTFLSGGRGEDQKADGRAGDRIGEVLYVRTPDGKADRPINRVGLKPRLEAP